MNTVTGKLGEVIHMNKIYLIIGAIILVIAVGGVIFIRQKSGSNTALKKEEIDIRNNVIVNKEGSRYQIYSKDAFTAAIDKKRILFFYAKWCPVCQPIDKEFSDMMDKIPADIVVFKTDFDTEVELKRLYSIPYQHTFVQVDANDKEVTAWSGGGLSELKKNIK